MPEINVHSLTTFNESAWRNDVKRLAERESYREIMKLSDGQISYAKAWRLANMSGTSIDIRDFLVMCSILGRNPELYFRQWV